MKTHEDPWKPMKTHEGPWRPMKTHEDPWRPMNSHENLWKYVFLPKKQNIVIFYKKKHISESKIKIEHEISNKTLMAGQPYFLDLMAG